MNHKFIFLVDNLDIGGVASAVRGFYTALNKFYRNVSIDFIVYRQPEEKTIDFFCDNNSRIFVIPSVSEAGFLKYKKNVRNILRKCGPYDGIYLNTGYFIWIAAREAKREGIHNRVGSAHGSKSSHKIVPIIGRVLNRIYCTSMFACSRKSGVFNFGKEVDFLPNIVDYSQIVTERDLHYYHEFGIPNDCTVIGYLGVFEPEKNTSFMIDIMEAYNEKEKMNYCIIAGDGSTFNEISDKIQKADSAKRIKTIGYRADGKKLLRFFDVLVAPSFSEGMSLTLLEAQLTGTPCVVSEQIPKTNDLQFGLYYTVKDFNPSNWVEAIEKALNSKHDTILQYKLDKLEQIGYDEKSVASKLYGALTKW